MWVIGTGKGYFSCNFEITGKLRQALSRASLSLHTLPWYPRIYAHISAVYLHPCEQCISWLLLPVTFTYIAVVYYAGIHWQPRLGVFNTVFIVFTWNLKKYIFEQFFIFIFVQCMIFEAFIHTWSQANFHEVTQDWTHNSQNLIPTLLQWATNEYMSKPPEKWAFVWYFWDFEAIWPYSCWRQI